MTLFCFGWSGGILGRRLNAKLVHLNFEQTKNDAMKDMDAMQKWSEKFQEWANRQAWVLLVFHVFACGKCLGAVGCVHVWIWMECFFAPGQGFLDCKYLTERYDKGQHAVDTLLSSSHRRIHVERLVQAASDAVSFLQRDGNSS